MEFNLDTDIDNLLFIDYMSKQQQKDDEEENKKNNDLHI